MKSALGKVKGLGAARSGTHHWWLQKATSVALVPLSIWFLVSIAMLTGAAYEELLAWVANPVVTVLLLVFSATVFYHFRLGIQVVIEDYVQTKGWKVATLLLNDAFALGFGLLTIISILRISLGSA